MMTSASNEQAGWVYDSILSERNGRFYLRIPELSLIVDGDDVAAAHARLENAKRDLFAKSALLGAPVPPPRDIRLKTQLRSATLPFLIKAAAVAVVGAVLMISAGIFVNYTLNESLRSASQKTARAAFEQIIRGLEDAGHRDLSGEREERLRAALRGVVPVLKPFVTELRPLFADTQEPIAR